MVITILIGIIFLLALLAAWLFRINKIAQEQCDRSRDEIEVMRRNSDRHYNEIKEYRAKADLSEPTIAKIREVNFRGAVTYADGHFSGQVELISSLHHFVQIMAFDRQYEEAMKEWITKEMVKLNSVRSSGSAELPASWQHYIKSHI